MDDSPDQIQLWPHAERTHYILGFEQAIEMVAKDGAEAAKGVLRTLREPEREMHRASSTAPVVRTDHLVAKTHFSGATLGDVHPCPEPGGWPEFEVTMTFYVKSDDPQTIERERMKVFEHVADPYVA